MPRLRDGLSFGRAIWAAGGSGARGDREQSPAAMEGTIDPAHRLPETTAVPIQSDAGGCGAVFLSGDGVEASGPDAGIFAAAVARDGKPGARDGDAVLLSLLRQRAGGGRRQAISSS